MMEVTKYYCDKCNKEISIQELQYVFLTHFRNKQACYECVKKWEIHVNSFWGEKW